MIDFFNVAYSMNSNGWHLWDTSLRPLARLIAETFHGFSDNGNY